MMCAQKLGFYFYNFNRKLLLYDGFVKFFDTNKTISINSGKKKNPNKSSTTVQVTKTNQYFREKLPLL